MLLRFIVIFLVVLPGCASINRNSQSLPTSPSKIDTHVQTSLIPSAALLKLVGIPEYLPSKEIRIVVGSGEARGTSGQMGQCEQPAVVPLQTLTNFKNVSMVIAAVETESHEKPKILFTLNNNGGLSPSSYFSARLNIREYNPGIANIWLFFFVEGKVYANAAQINCQVVN